jgi:hypothetical protein
VARFRHVESKEQVVEACRVRLNTPVEKLLNDKGIVTAARLGEWVVRGPAEDSEDPHNPRIMSHEAFIEQYVPLDQAGQVDRISGVHGIENFAIEEDDEPGNPGADVYRRCVVQGDPSDVPEEKKGGFFGRGKK